MSEPKVNESKPSETKSKKMVRRSVAIALGIICIILIAGMVEIWLYYLVQDIEKDETINTLHIEIFNKNSLISQLNATNTDIQNQNSLLQTWLNENETLLSQTQTWLSGNITYYNSQITNLQNQLKPFQGPFLGFSDLTAVDNRTVPENPYLQINGTIHNFGIDGALVLFHVEAHHDDGSVAIETDVTPNSTIFWGIDGQSSIDVDLNYYYNGSALASWTIIVGEIIVI